MIYPDKLMISDMIENKDNFWAEIDSNEYQQVLANCEKNKTKRKF